MRRLCGQVWPLQRRAAPHPGAGQHAAGPSPVAARAAKPHRQDAPTPCRGELYKHSAHAHHDKQRLVVTTHYATAQREHTQRGGRGPGNAEPHDPAWNAWALWMAPVCLAARGREAAAGARLDEVAVEQRGAQLAHVAGAALAQLLACAAGHPRGSALQCCAASHALR